MEKQFEVLMVNIQNQMEQLFNFNQQVPKIYIYYLYYWLVLTASSPNSNRLTLDLFARYAEKDGGIMKPSNLFSLYNLL